MTMNLPALALFARVAGAPPFITACRASPAPAPAISG